MKLEAILQENLSMTSKFIILRVYFKHFEENFGKANSSRM